MPETERQRNVQTALRLARGVRRLLHAQGAVSLTEMPLPNGRRADILALASNGDFLIVEIKSGVADFRADRKWPYYRLHCDRFYFAVSAETPQEILPDDAGLIVADAFGAEILREAPEHRLAGATRRALLLQFARAGLERLHKFEDPDRASFLSK